MELDFNQLKELIKLINDSKITQFELNAENAEIKISKNAPQAALIAAAEPPKTAQTAPSDEPITILPETSVPKKEGNYITSPIVGRFYSSASPEQPPLAPIGKRVKEGDVVCIIETMKVMNEIPSPFGGEIAEILVENDRPVEYGQPLFRVV